MGYTVYHRQTGKPIFKHDSDVLHDVRGALEAAAKQKHPLHEADLRMQALTLSSLRGANLQSIDLSYACICNVDFTDTDLSGATLVDADLSDCYLRRTNLSGANLAHSHFHYCHDEDVIFSDRTVLPSIVTWKEFREELIPKLLTHAGATLAEMLIPDNWQSRTWPDCPMGRVFGGQWAISVPPELRPLVNQFMRLYDTGFLPLNELRRLYGLAPITGWEKSIIGN